MIQPYLFFGGRCDEAIAFYGRVLGAHVQFLLRHSESPEPPPPGTVPDGFEQKVMHATIRIGDAEIMMSDGCGEEAAFAGFRLSVQLADEAAARRAFDGLADGGTVDLPIGPTFWSSCFGMVTDRFGLGWMVSVEGETGA